MFSKFKDDSNNDSLKKEKAVENTENIIRPCNNQLDIKFKKISKLDVCKSNNCNSNSEETKENKISSIDKINLLDKNNPHNVNMINTKNSNSNFSSKVNNQMNNNSVNNIDNLNPNFDSQSKNSLISNKSNSNIAKRNANNDCSGRIENKNSIYTMSNINYVPNSINTINHLNIFNNSSLENLMYERYICEELEYNEINFNINKQIQRSDFLLDDFMGPRLIINPFEVYNKKQVDSFYDMRFESISSNNNYQNNKTKISSENRDKENENTNVNSDFYNNKDLILKNKIQEAINGNIMDKIVSSSDAIIKFSGVINIDEDYIKK